MEENQQGNNEKNIPNNSALQPEKYKTIQGNRKEEQDMKTSITKVCGTINFNAKDNLNARLWYMWYILLWCVIKKNNCQIEKQSSYIQKGSYCQPRQSGNNKKRESVNE